MSNKRRKQAEAEFFVYESGIEVPRDVTHILVHQSVKVLPAWVFQGLIHLKEVVLSEGLRLFERKALKGCTSLERVSFPSTLLRINDDAFRGCTSLRTLDFSEGLLEIGTCAFDGCTSLLRISLSSTVTGIRCYAFDGCYSLAVVILVDGLRTIGAGAFRQCALESILLPATLTAISYRAFNSCQSLRMAKLGGGIQLIEGNAFMECDLLNYVRVTPKSLVITITEDGDDFDFEFAADGRIVSRAGFDRVVIASECFHSMSAAEVSTLEIDMIEILEMQLEWDGKWLRLRELLAPHERRRKEEVAGLLELGLRKADMRHSAEKGLGIGEELPFMCKADVIGKNVIAFL